MNKGAIGVAIVISLALAALFALVWWQSPSPGQATVEVLRILVSWPLVIGLIAFAFRNELSSFLKRVGTIRFPGGAEISSSPPQADPMAKSREKQEEGAIPLTAKDLQEIDNYIQGLQQKIQVGQQERQELEKATSSLLETKQREVVFWWFEFLSLFLVPITQLVLRWFSMQITPPTKGFYDEFCKLIISDTKQRETILMVLLHHNLVVTQDGFILTITEAGRHFLAHMDAKAPAMARTGAPR